MMLRTLICIWAGMIIVSLFLIRAPIRDPTNPEELEKLNTKDTVSLRSIIKSRQFILLWSMLFLSICKFAKCLKSI